MFSLTKLGKYEEAKICFNKANELNPQFTKYYNEKDLFHKALSKKILTLKEIYKIN